jgi:hypothetical protein
VKANLAGYAALESRYALRLAAALWRYTAIGRSNRVENTVERDLPQEVAYLESYDRFVRGVQEFLDMPANTLDLLHRFLQQNEGVLSKRARTKEFQKLTEDEIARIERIFCASRGSPAGSNVD